MIDDTPEEFRFLFLEDSSAGKSSIINRFLDDVFQEDITPTSGMTLSQKIFRLDHEETIKIINYDFSGNFEKNKDAFESTIKKSSANAIVIVYTSNLIFKNEQEESITNWLNEIREITPENMLIALVLNKTDLLKDNLKYYINNGEAFALKNNTLFFSTSAKDNIGITELYQELICKINNWREV